jgi:hypothetical protein
VKTRFVIYFFALAASLVIPSSSYADLNEADVVSGIKEANSLVDEYVRGAETSDKLLFSAKQLLGKFILVDYESFQVTLSDLEARKKINSSKLSSLKETLGAQCKDFLSNSGKDTEVEDACYELSDALAAASDAKLISEESLALLTPLILELQELSSKLEAEAKAAAEKAAAELKAKQEAEARAAAEKAAAELKAKQAAEARAAAEKAAASKKTTITCIKGKLTKKVTAVNPKCPAGYKKK